MILVSGMMDVDTDVEGSLSQAFGCMGTVDREVLVNQFQQVLGQNHPIAADSCAFFLDMNNWNLQAALGSYYDYMSMSSNGMTGVIPPEYVSRLPSMQFVQDVTIGEGESIPRQTRFVKTWRLRNCGEEKWPNGCFVCHIEGEQMADTSRACVPALEVGQEGDVSVEMTSPEAKGIYESRWQLNTPEGMPFGESIWCIITVEETGLLGITQQMASAPLGTSNSLLSPKSNPFSIPLAFNKDKISSGNAAEPHSSNQWTTVTTSFDQQVLIDECVERQRLTKTSLLERAVAAAFPQQWNEKWAKSEEEEEEEDEHHFAQPSTPIQIVRTSPNAGVTAGEDCTSCCVPPPCTPCTPPLDDMHT